MAPHQTRGMFVRAASWALLTALAFAACPFGYDEYVPGKCMHHYTAEDTFDNSRFLCQNDGVDLISIHSQAENDAIFAAMPAIDNAWIGLKCDPVFKRFNWVDDTPVDFFGFDSVTCNDMQNGFVMEQDSGLWKFGTDKKYHFICGIDMTATVDGRCDGDGYQFDEETSMCLKIVKEPVSWTIAEINCNDFGGHLVSIHDQQMNVAIRRLAVNEKLYDGIFIGLHVQPNGTFTWTDGTPNSFSNFDVGMPNSLFGECGAMLTRILEAKWVSVHCDSLLNLPYVCAKPGNVVESMCPGNNTFTDQGEIYSPGYPSSNSSSLTCEYFMAAEDDRHVLIEFPEIVLAAGDSITLYEGETSANVITTLNSTTQPGGIYQTSSDNVLRMVYQAGPDIRARSWHAKFMTVF